MSELWRYTVGIKGLNRVSVYERVPDGPLQVLWYDKFGMHRETLKNMAGVPVYDRARAVKIAERMAAAQREQRESAVGRDLLGLPERHTVRELFARLHTDSREEWSDKWASDQARHRKFWERALGGGTDITEVKPAAITNAVRSEVKARSKNRKQKTWAPKTQNHYLLAAIEAWAYAERQLKWITPAHNLEAVKLNRLDEDNSELAYESDEARALLAALEHIDLRGWVCGELAYFGGRRLEAIRTLPSTCYRTEDRILPETGVLEFGVVRFPAKTDKAKRRGEVYLLGDAKRAIEMLLARPAVQASGNLCPQGNLDNVAPRQRPMTQRTLRRMLRTAEEQCGIEHVERRAYHGLKRIFATDVDFEHLGGASAQSGTTDATLLRKYKQPKPEEKAALAIQLDGLRRA